MGFNKRDDPPEDRTIGIPARKPRVPDALKPPDAAKAPPPPPLPPAPPAREPKPERPPAPRPPVAPVYDEHMGTIGPPRVPRRPPVAPFGEAPAPPPSAAPRADDRGRGPAPARPPGFGTGGVAPPVPQPWEDEDPPSDMNTAMGPPARSPGRPAPVANPGPPVFDPGWTVVGEKPALPPAPAPVQAPPQHAPPAYDPKTPPADARFVPASPPRLPHAARPPAPEMSGTPTLAGIVFENDDLAASRVLMLQYFDGKAWRDLGQVQPEGHVVGRNSFSKASPASRFLAAEHLVIDWEGERVSVQEGNTVNGVYIRVSPRLPVELNPGARFLVGNHVIEFRPAEPRPPVEPRVGDDGEVFRSRSLVPLAFLDFVGLDGEVELSFPLTKPEGTIIGREGESCGIALTGDDLASRAKHARVFSKNGRFMLEDLQSTNSTFLRISGRTPIHVGSARDPASSDVLLVGALLVRVVDL